MPARWSNKEMPVVRRVLKQIKADWVGSPEAQQLIDAVAFEWGFDLGSPFTRDDTNPNRAQRVQVRPIRKQTPEALAEFKAMVDAMKTPEPSEEPVVEVSADAQNP